MTIWIVSGRGSVTYFIRNHIESYVVVTEIIFTNKNIFLKPSRMLVSWISNKNETKLNHQKFPLTRCQLKSENGRRLWKIIINLLRLWYKCFLSVNCILLAVNDSSSFLVFLTIIPKK